MLYLLIDMILLLLLVKCLLGGHAVAYLVEVQCYKPEGRRFESRCRIFQLT
jgi:hypothetical protein